MRLVRGNSPKVSMTIAGAIEKARKTKCQYSKNRVRDSLQGYSSTKKIDELAEELAHTYADEMQENMLSENAETEQIPILEVTESGEVDFENQPENSEENSRTGQNKDNMV